MDKITVVIKKVGKDPTVTQIDNTLEAMQSVVDGSIEHVGLHGFDVWVNEEGKLRGLEGNIYLEEIDDILCGDILVTKSNDEGETIGLTKKDIDTIIGILTLCPDLGKMNNWLNDYE